MEQNVLETERLTLRPLNIADAGHIALYAGDLRVSRNLEQVPHPYPPGLAESFITRVTSGKAGETVWAIQHSDGREAQLIGMMGVTDEGTLGYWLAAPFWDTGFATEAAEAVVTEALRDHVTLRAEVFQGNEASAKVLTKIGFAYVGEGQTFSLARNGQVDTWRYVLERDKWNRF